MLDRFSANIIILCYLVGLLALDFLSCYQTTVGSVSGAWLAVGHTLVPNIYCQLKKKTFIEETKIRIKTLQIADNSFLAAVICSAFSFVKITDYYSRKEG